ncbi:UNKNOWN [Stylonychia lemnae]|uniref:Uncharacterized protein n=1 Tax=Stylonychia lemnae TaxID=5949 RepID=A0A078APE6_STYLE|nr:UNKNOWN [Stylonychia lemnae]|eukprot:CDW83821.1 UNKNOWN [Stylonychia lemnae]
MPIIVHIIHKIQTRSTATLPNFSKSYPPRVIEQAQRTAGINEEINLSSSSLPEDIFKNASPNAATASVQTNKNTPISCITSQTILIRQFVYQNILNIERNFIHISKVEIDKMHLFASFSKQQSQNSKN